MPITSSRLRRAAGLAAIAAGTLYVAIQPIHPEETVEAVTSSRWVVVAAMTMAMAVLALVGITAVYLRQVREAGVLGLVAYGMFGFFYLLVVAHSFAEIFIIPELADVSPRFVDSFNGIFSGEAGPMDLGAVEALNPVTALLYVVGGSLFGISIYRARVLDRRVGLAVTVGALSAVAAAVLPHAAGRYAAVPLGLAMIWLGWSSWRLEAAATPETVAIPEARPEPTATSPAADRV